MKQLKIHNFGPIQDVDIVFKKYNFLIGGQGVGKSTIAKLLSIVTDYNLYFEFAFKGDDAIHLWHQFLGNYGILNYEKEDSLIEYTEEGVSCVGEKKEAYKLTVCVTAKEVAVEMVNDGQPVPLQEVAKVLLYSIADRAETEEFKNRFGKEDPSVIIDVLRDSLYIPAERMMYASFTKLLPALNLVKETVSDNMLYFAVEYNNAKAKIEHCTMPVLGVDFMHEKDDDYIVTADGKHLLIREASSGMQSTIPLLLTLDYATDKKGYHSYVVEEPECNLYPTNQLRLMDVVLDYIKRKRSTLTITTHSPYIINYLNVLIRRNYKGLDNGLSPEEMSAYYVTEEGGVTDLMAVDNDSSEWLVNTFDLSEPMNDIYSEYIALNR